MAEFCAAARALSPSRGDWAEWTKSARADYLAFSTAGSMPGAVNYSAIIAWLSDTLPENAVIANGAGNFSIWVHRFFRYKRYGTQLAPQSGAMGYGAPAGVAAGIRHPDRIVVSVSGDGCFLMNGQELATAAQQNVAVVFIVVNNGIYGTIRMHQERHYPGRPSGTDLANPDFAALARSYGAHGETVRRTEEFAPAFERARAAHGPALIELAMDPEAVLPTSTLAEIRARALAERARTNSP